ncbi:hypothetical protein SLS62_006391 [Diatrype stigma]|uniref:Zn(2)-C6 fungal-type domain-containing protein n=1 Tax=Diatrype stigma TaxID=117547 RepID=A0AAN9YS02_9PEZI
MPYQGGPDYVWRRACLACARSKRQCTKQVPTCRRCARKGICCKYAPARRATGEPAASSAAANTVGKYDGTLAAAGDSASLLPMDTAAATTAATSDPAYSLPMITHVGFDDQALPPPPTPPQPLGAAPSSRPPDTSMTTTATTDTSWFLSPETWITDHAVPYDAPTTFDDGHLRHFLADVQKWHRQWVTEGHSPLHHARLYRYQQTSMPRCVQDAYTALAALHAAKPGSPAEALARQLIDDRVTQLLQEQALETSLASSSSSTTNATKPYSSSPASSSSSRDPFAHLSRVHALLAYQAVRLLDGDIRMRARAEALIPTLSQWCREMWEDAKARTALLPVMAGGGDDDDHRSLFLASSSFLPLSPSSSEADFEFELAFGLGLGGSGPDPDPDAAATATWRTWIVVESIRRAWVAANYLQSTYMHMKQGWAECPGRITFTMRRGLWDMPSAYAWSRVLRDARRRLLLLPSREQSFFADVPPADVDDFAHAILSIEYGLEKIERWRGDHRIVGLDGKNNDAVNGMTAPLRSSFDILHDLGVLN